MYRVYTARLGGKKTVRVVKTDWEERRQRQVVKGRVTGWP